MKLLLVGSLCFLALAMHAQKPGVFLTETNKTMEDAFGRPLRTQTTYNVEGTPYYPEEYCKATLSFSNSNMHSRAKAKLNLYDNTILFVTEKGLELEVIVSVDKIEFMDSLSGKTIVFQKGFTGSGLQEKIYYQVLDTGKIILLKHIAVTYRDFSPYGTAVITRSFQHRLNYYILKNSLVFKAEKNNGNIPGLLAEKKKEIADYIAANNISLKTESGLIAIVNYYNGLR